MNKPISIFLLDDHKLFRDGIRAVLSDEPNISITGEAGSSVELFRLLENTHPDILIADIELPGMSGIEIAANLHQTRPEIKVLVISMHQNEEYVMNACRAGAMGFLPKETGKEELVTAINRIAGGDTYYNADITGKIIRKISDHTRNTEVNPLTELSKREIEILKFFAEGYSNLEIAEKLFISIRTVESHKNHIMQKLMVKSQVDLVKIAIRYKLVNL
ncbi:MAG: response regulator transcription factor [Bacteroidales bacterium]|nr:response regulator transcription factor [Bacteroidales bacterium]HOE05206.1 response regulator transcription factor [Bacteroidales bacterium]HOY37875.1 response regulator transcription factor [Bacteroidales bacterium]